MGIFLNKRENIQGRNNKTGLKPSLWTKQFTVFCYTIGLENILEIKSNCCYPSIGHQLKGNQSYNSLV